MKRHSKYLLACHLVVIFAIFSSCNTGSDNEKSPLKPAFEKQNIYVSAIHSPDSDIIIKTDTTPLYKAHFDRNIGEITKKDLTQVGTRTNEIKIQENAQLQSKELSKEIAESIPRLKYISITFDNDIFDNTDYYYTNGINIELVSPLAQSSPSSKLLPGIRSANINVYGLTIKHNMYTPTNPETPEVIVGDRPFAAFLTIGNNRKSYHIDKKLQLSSEFNFGVLGPASLGGKVQDAIHESNPVGWQNQIQNSLVIDYSISLEKGLISTPHFETNASVKVNVGTLYNNIGGGVYFRAGNFLPVYRGPVASKIFQYWFFIRGNANLVLYDATLQGGLFSNQNTYTISSSDINRYVVNASIGFALYYGDVGIEFENFYISPEFKGAYDFRWGRLKLIINI